GGRWPVAAYTGRASRRSARQRRHRSHSRRPHRVREPCSSCDTTMSELFIRRPVMTILVMVGIIVFGIVAYRTLPISDLPTVDYPTINVNASLAGASPETMAAAVAT